MRHAPTTKKGLSITLGSFIGDNFLQIFTLYEFVLIYLHQNTKCTLKSRVLTEFHRKFSGFHLILQKQKSTIEKAYNFFTSSSLVHQFIQ